MGSEDWSEFVALAAKTLRTFEKRTTVWLSQAEPGVTEPDCP